MGDLHYLNNLLRDCARFLLLHQLCKDAFKIWKAHQLNQIRGRSIGQNSSFCNHDDTAANLFDDFKHMRDIENGFALRSEQLEEIFE